METSFVPEAYRELKKCQESSYLVREDAFTFELWRTKEGERREKSERASNDVFGTCCLCTCPAGRKTLLGSGAQTTLTYQILERPERKCRA